VDHGTNLGVRLVDLAVNVAFGILIAAVQVHRIAVQVVLDQVRRGDEIRRQRAREIVVIGILIAADADVTEGIVDALLMQNPVGRYQVFNQLRFGLCRGRRSCLRAGEHQRRACQERQCSRGE